MLPFFAFASNGLLVGVMVAFSSDHLSKIFIPLLFAAFGGSVASFGRNLNTIQKREAYSGLLALSLFCTIGIIFGVLAVQYRWLSPDSISVARDGYQRSPSDTKIEVREPDLSLFYLRSQTTDAINGVDTRVRQGLISKGDAYDELIKVLHGEASAR